MLSKNLKGQIGETLTWVIATILIVVVLIFFILGSSLLGNTKKIGNFHKSLTSKTTFEGTDAFLKKSLFTYLLLQSETKRTLLENKLWKMSVDGKFNLDFNETKKDLVLKYDEK